MTRRVRFLALAMATAVLAWLAHDPAGSQPVADPPKGGSSVHVTELPQGERELVGVTADGAHVLRLSARGDVVSWTDPAGDVPLQPPNSDLPAVEVVEVRDRNKRLLPAAKT